jgi:hypothetical protein
MGNPSADSSAPDSPQGQDLKPTPQAQPAPQQPPAPQITDQLNSRPIPNPLNPSVPSSPQQLQPFAAPQPFNMQSTATPPSPSGGIARPNIMQDTDSEAADRTVRQRGQQLESGLDALEAKSQASGPNDGTPNAPVADNVHYKGYDDYRNPADTRNTADVAVNSQTPLDRNMLNPSVAAANPLAQPQQGDGLHPATAAPYKQSQLAQQLGETPQASQWIDSQLALRGGRTTALGTYDGGDWHGKTQGFARTALHSEFKAGYGQNQGPDYSNDPAANAWAERQMAQRGGREGRGIYQEGEWKGKSPDYAKASLLKSYKPGMQ